MSRPPLDHVSNTGGARRSAWKSLMPTSSKPGRADDRQGRRRIGRAFSRGQTRSGRVRRASSLAGACVRLRRVLPRDPTRPAGSGQRFSAWELGSKATRPARDAGRVPPLPVGEQLRPLDRRRDLSEQLHVKRRRSRIDEGVRSVASVPCGARYGRPVASPRSFPTSRRSSSGGEVLAGSWPSSLCRVDPRGVRVTSAGLTATTLHVHSA